MAKKDPAAYRQAVTLAVRAFSAHPQASLTDGPTYDDEGAVAQVAFDLSFGGRWLATGGSPTGVRPVETVELRFPPDYPLQPPSLSLRADFGRNCPHIQPWLTATGRVVPCLVDGPINEFIAAAGLRGLADQAYAWLNSAAEGRLIDGGRGWEPARRDELSSFLAIDEDGLRGLAEDHRGGFQFFSSDYYCDGDPLGGGGFYYGTLGERATLKLDIRERLLSDRRHSIGVGFVVAVWPEPDAQGRPWISDEYLPDDTSIADALWDRARDHGVEGPLRRALALMKHRCASKEGADFPLVVLMLVRRPRPLAGADSPIELFGYVTPLRHPGGALEAENDPVWPVGLHNSLSGALMQRMSGTPIGPKWALLGAGSLGSKVGLHLGRQAWSPFLVVDKGVLTPHNAARHGLYPSGPDRGAGWLSAKADALASTLRGLGGEARGLKGDHLTLAQDLRPMRGKSQPRWLVNTTASLVVRETLASPDFESLPRQIEMALYGTGRIGLMAVEGERRNPNTLELATALYQRAADDPRLGADLLADEAVGRIETGQGCGSLTTMMTDARISTMAALCAEAFTALPDEPWGHLRLFRRDADLGVNAEAQEVAAFHRIPIDGMPGWTLSLSTGVKAEIKTEAALHPATETGGVLIGRASALARSIIVTALEPAPPDSERRHDLFVLGIEGLAEAIEDRRARSGGLLDVVGTWHSHLGSARPSGTDHGSAAIVGASATSPMSLLIIGTDGFRAIAATPQEAGAH